MLFGQKLILFRNRWFCVPIKILRSNLLHAVSGLISIPRRSLQSLQSLHCVSIMQLTFLVVDDFC